MWAVALPMLLMQVNGPLSPQDAIAQAHKDLSSLPVEVRYDVRYLSLYAVKEKDRAEKISTLNGFVNSLGREQDLVPLYVVPNTNGSLLRLYLRDYRWDVKTWEKLADPHFTQVIEFEDQRDWPGGMYEGKYYEPKAFKTKHGVKKQQTLGPWLSTDEISTHLLANVTEWTGSRIPVVRAEWFFNQVAAAVDRTPNYYDFLGIKDEKSFQEIVGADIPKAEKFGKEIRESVAMSGVTLQPRAIVRHGTINGSYWRTFDFRIAKGEQNPLLVIGKDIEKAYDASEQYAHLANGLWAVGLFDKNGNVQATAPDFIASDSTSRSTDKRVHNASSCFRCHTNGGLQNIDGWIRNQLTSPFQLQTQPADDTEKAKIAYEQARKLRRQYLEKLEPLIVKDRLVYEESIKQVTGMTSKEYAAAYSKMWEGYEDSKIGLNEAAAALGCTPDRLKLTLSNRIKAGRGDTILSVLVLPDGRPNRIPIRQFEEAIPLGHEVIRGLEK